MKRWIIGLAAFAFIAFGALAVAQNRMEGQGGIWAIGSGGVINIESGGQLQVGGTDKTSALSAAVTAPVNGIAAGYKIARGETALGGTNPTNITTGLTTIIACTATVKKTTAPTSEETITYTTSSGTLSLYVWQPTSTAVTTLVASPSTATVGWICIGT